MPWRLPHLGGRRRVEGPDLVTFGKVAVDGERRAQSFGAYAGGKVGESAGKLVGVDVGGAKKGELAAARPVGEVTR